MKSCATASGPSRSPIVHLDVKTLGRIIGIWRIWGAPQDDDGVQSEPASTHTLGLQAFVTVVLPCGGPDRCPDHHMATRHARIVGSRYAGSYRATRPLRMRYSLGVLRSDAGPHLGLNRLGYHDQPSHCADAKGIRPSSARASSASVTIASSGRSATRAASSASATRETAILFLIGAGPLSRWFWLGPLPNTYRTAGLRGDHPLTSGRRSFAQSVSVPGVAS
jgi:hypothetical protein